MGHEQVQGARRRRRPRLPPRRRIQVPAVRAPLAPHTVAPTHSVASRYYHVFREGELDALVSSIPGAKIEEAYFDHANWCVRIRKMAP